MRGTVKVNMRYRNIDFFKYLFNNEAFSKKLKSDIKLFINCVHPPITLICGFSLEVNFGKQYMKKD